MNNLVKSVPVTTRPSTLRRFMPNIFSELIDDFSSPSLYMQSLLNEVTEPQIRVNVSEKSKEFIVKAEIPGAKKEDIHISIDGSYVNITAERATENEEKSLDERIIRSEYYFGSSSRGFQLPSDINRDKVKANYENGILELVLPKMNGSISREIKIS
jgi:HSP20 family protein